MCNNSPFIYVIKFSPLQKGSSCQSLSLVQTTMGPPIKKAAITATASSPLNRGAALPHQRDTTSESASVTDHPHAAAVLCQRFPTNNHAPAGQVSSNRDFWLMVSSCGRKPVQSGCSTLTCCCCQRGPGPGGLQDTWGVS